MDKHITGDSHEGGSLSVDFGPKFDWQARVTRNRPAQSFELQITQSHPDWMGTAVGCELRPEGQGATRVKFYIPVGPKRMNIGEFHVSVGQCTCEFCDGISNTERRSNTRGD